jgi:hypothetical protein
MLVGRVACFCVIGCNASKDRHNTGRIEYEALVQKEDASLFSSLQDILSCISTIRVLGAGQQRVDDVME